MSYDVRTIGWYSTMGLYGLTYAYMSFVILVKVFVNYVYTNYVCVTCGTSAGSASYKIIFEGT